MREGINLSLLEATIWEMRIPGQSLGSKTGPAGQRQGNRDLTSTSQRPCILTVIWMSLGVDFPQAPGKSPAQLTMWFHSVRLGCAQSSNPQNWEIIKGAVFEVFFSNFYGSNRKLIHIVKTNKQKNPDLLDYLRSLWKKVTDRRV